MTSYDTTVLGAGYSGLTTAAELANSGERVLVIAQDLGYRPQITICGTQSRRWPGLAQSTQTFQHADLLEKECKTMQRFLAIANIPESGVQCIPALKVSKNANVEWNKHKLEEAALWSSTEVQSNAKIACGRSADPAMKERLRKAGYKSVDETQVIMVDTNRYFQYLMGVVKRAGGCVALGATVSADDIANLKSKVVINCMGNRGATGGDAGKYVANPGQAVLVTPSPGPCPVYVIDDDANAAIVETSDGSLYLSSAATPKGYPAGGYDSNCTQQTCDDCKTICEAVLGRSFNASDVSESIVFDRPTRAEGFSAGTLVSQNGKTVVQNTGHAGAGIAASWACAADAARAAKRARTQ